MNVLVELHDLLVSAGTILPCDSIIFPSGRGGVGHCWPETAPGKVLCC
jgi:hypothetical protein